MPPSATDSEAVLRTRLQHLASKRAHPKTLCPSEVARSFTSSELHDDLDTASWRDLMPQLRTLCFTLRDEGTLEILQRGEVIDGGSGEEDVAGPIRIRIRLTQSQSHNVEGNGTED